MFHVACLMISHKDHLIMNDVSWSLPDNVLCFMRLVWLWTMSLEAKMRIKLFLMRPTWWWTMSNGAHLMMNYVSLGLPDVEPYFMQPAWWRNMFNAACLIRSHFSCGPSDDSHVLWGLAGDDLCLMKYTLLVSQRSTTMFTFGQIPSGKVWIPLSS